MAVHRSPGVANLVNDVCAKGIAKNRRGVLGTEKCQIRICTKGGSQITHGRTGGITTGIGRRFPSVPICTCFRPPH